jgi:membrane protein DedA with SNARE-associated domain
MLEAFPFITNDRLVKLEEKFKKWGALFVFFVRHLLGLRTRRNTSGKTGLVQRIGFS